MSRSEHLITREIGIDAGHRVTYHGSKCRNIHGHRYTIHATCAGPLFDAGEQEGMVLDFGFLKEEMMDAIDRPCDHGMIMWEKDPLVDTMAGTSVLRLMNNNMGAEAVEHQGTIGKMYIVAFVPTAENLARHWYDVLRPRVEARSEGQARLVEVKVWETPNCSASYPSK